MGQTLANTTSQFQNPDGLDKEQLETIRGYFGRLAEVDAELSARVLRFLIDGSDEEPGSTVPGVKAGPMALPLV